jgi:DNA-binding transcriptional LysR family regulator
VNLRQLETLLAIVEHGSFAKAANALHTTQSTVSARVRDLERYLGAPLFDRLGRRAQLTSRGEDMLPFARQFVDYARSLEPKFRDPAAMSGLLRMGVVGVVANTWLPRLVTAIRERHPRVTLRLDMSLTRTLIERLRAGRLDLAIIAGQVAEPGLHSMSLGYDDFVWMAGPALAIPQRPLGPKELQRWPILSLSEDSYHYSVIERWFRDAGALYFTTVSCNNMNVIAALTEAGVGVSLLPRHCYSGEISGGRLRVLVTRPRLPAVEFSLIVRRDLAQPVVASFVDLAKRASRLARR